MSDDTKALVLRLRSHRTWVSSEGMLTTVDPDCAEAATTIERLEHELDEARRDAARYRWIASHEYSTGHIEVTSEESCMDCHGFDTPQVHGLSHSPLGSAIDAAIAKERR